MDNTAVIVGVDEQRAFVDTHRDFGDEMMAVSLNDGSYIWSTIAAPNGTWSQVADTLFVEQKLGKDYVESAYNSATGEKLWSHSFTIPPILSTREGEFLIKNAEGNLVLADLAGIEGQRRWKPNSACAILSVARDPASAGFYAEESCAGGVVYLVKLDKHLKKLNQTRVILGLEYAQVSTEGPYLVFYTSSDGRAIVIRDGTVVYRGRDLSVTNFSIVGDDLAIVLSDGDPYFLIDRNGTRVVPGDTTRFFVGSTSVFPFQAHRYRFFDPRTKKEIGSRLESGSSSQFTLLQSGESAVELIDSTSTVIRRVDLARTGKSTPRPALTVAKGAISVGQVRYQLESEDSVDPAVLSLNVQAVETSQRTEIELMRFRTTADANESWLKYFRQEKDPLQFKNKNLVVRDDATFLRSGRCLARLSGANEDVNARDALDGVIFTEIVHGCNV